MKKLEIFLTGAGVVLIVTAIGTRISSPMLSWTLFLLSVVCCLGEMFVTFIRENVIEPQKEKDLLRRQTEQVERTIIAPAKDCTIILSNFRVDVKDGDTYDARRS